MTRLVALGGKPVRRTRGLRESSAAQMPRTQTAKTAALGVQRGRWNGRNQSLEECRPAQPTAHTPLGRCNPSRRRLCIPQCNPRQPALMLTLHRSCLHRESRRNPSQPSVPFLRRIGKVPRSTVQPRRPASITGRPNGLWRPQKLVECVRSRRPADGQPSIPAESYYFFFAFFFFLDCCCPVLPIASLRSPSENDTEYPSPARLAARCRTISRAAVE